jgi:hypothetical protein
MTTWTLEVRNMMEDHDESALLGQLRDECKKISLMVE